MQWWWWCKWYHSVMSIMQQRELDYCLILQKKAVMIEQLILYPSEEFDDLTSTYEDCRLVPGSEQSTEYLETGGPDENLPL